MPSHSKQPSPDFLMPPPSSTSSMNPAAVQRHDMAPPRIDRGEADAVIQELRRRRDEDDIENFHHYELDADQRLKSLFWADIDSCLDCMFHGDVVVLDTTFRATKYGLPFVAFVGLNHHRTPEVFGCGVTSDQSLDSFVWLLRAFKQAGHTTPKSVITDGGDAVVGAVKVVFPEASHRMCSWHVERGIEEHLHGASARNEFRSLVCDACSPAAFEARWHGFMAKHRTAANRRWLDAMYGKRELWAAAFVHGKFFLGMASDQRTECLGTPLHTGLHGVMSLPDLLEHADACTESLRYDMARLELKADSSRVELITRHRYLEERAARWFTPANFYLVREEIEMIDSFEVVETLDGGNKKKVYVVGFKQRRGVLFDVRCSDDDGVVACSCRKMEREGLPCRHIFCMMHHRSMSALPDCCALRRLRRRGDTKAERLDEMEGLGRLVFDLASEDAQEFEEIKGFFERRLEERWRGFRAVAAEEDSNGGDGAADAESGTPVTKKIKLLDG